MNMLKIKNFKQSQRKKKNNCNEGQAIIFYYLIEESLISPTKDLKKSRISFLIVTGCS